jgi:hypothetical protein
VGEHRQPSGRDGDGKGGWVRRPAIAWLARGLWVLVILGIGLIVRFDQLLRSAGRPELTQLDPSTGLLVMAALVSATVGMLLAGRRPRHPVGWLLLGVGLAVTASGERDGYARYGLLARPGSLPGAHWAAVYSPATVYLAFVCVVFVLLLTPTGRLPSRRWRPLAWVLAAGPVLFLLALTLGPGLVVSPYEPVVNPVAVPALAGVVRVAVDAAVAIAVAGLGAGGWALVVRFRRATGVERQQLRWLALAAAATLPAGAVVAVGVALGVTAGPLLQVALGTCMSLLPLATGAAIARYRLYDLDRIISRTVSYGLLSVLLAGLYAVGVLVIGHAVSPGGRANSLVVAATTLAVAAAFQPLRRRIQRVVDRRFDRRRYDAARTIDAFAAGLRRHVDLGALEAELVGTVEQTMQPTRVRLWLRAAQR